MQWDNTTLFSDDNPADRAFREEVRDWIAANCPKELCDRPLRIDPPELKPWHRKLYERGWIAPHWPKAAGGMGATLTQQIILFEEMSRVGAPTPYPHGLSFIGPLIIDAGTPEQKAKHLPGILTGDVTWCQGYSEPGSGSDLASLSTRAVLDGDSFVVNGHKIWTTNGHFADWMFALVRTDPEAKPRHAGITMLLIDLKSPGITVRPIQTIRGDSEFAEEFFVDVRVPKENMLGALNGGWQVANKLLGSERFTTGHPRNAAVILNKARQVAEYSGRGARSGVPAPSRSARDRSAGVFGVLSPRREPACPRQGARLDGAGHQDRRRRTRPAGLGTAGRRGGAARLERRRHHDRQCRAQSGRRSVRDAPCHGRQRHGRNPAQYHRQARPQSAVVIAWTFC